MKDKIIFFLFGAFVMYLVTYFLPFGQPSPTAPAVQQAAKPATSNQPPIEQVRQPEPSSPEDVAEESIVKTEQEKRPRIDLSRQNGVFRAFKLQKLKASSVKFLGENSAKSEQLLVLADKKIARDQELIGTIAIDINDEVAQAEQQLMITDDSELTPEQLLIKQAKIKQGQEYTELVEQNRVEFEDELKNLLSNKELDAFQQDEQTAAQRDFKRYVGNLENNAKINIEDLNSFQTSKLNRLFSDYAKRTLNDIPIGSTISANPISIPNNELITQLYEDLESILSQEQLEQFRSRPIMFDFSN